MPSFQWFRLLFCVWLLSISIAVHSQNLGDDDDDALYTNDGILDADAFEFDDEKPSDVDWSEDAYVDHDDVDNEDVYDEIDDLFSDIDDTQMQQSEQTEETNEDAEESDDDLDDVVMDNDELSNDDVDDQELNHDDDNKRTLLSDHSEQLPIASDDDDDDSETATATTEKRETMDDGAAEDFEEPAADDDDDSETATATTEKQEHDDSLHPSRDSELNLKEDEAADTIVDDDDADYDDDDDDNDDAYVDHSDNVEIEFENDATQQTYGDESDAYVDASNEHVADDHAHEYEYEHLHHHDHHDHDHDHDHDQCDDHAHDDAYVNGYRDYDPDADEEEDDEFPADPHPHPDPIQPVATHQYASQSTPSMGWMEQLNKLWNDLVQELQNRIAVATNDEHEDKSTDYRRLYDECDLRLTRLQQKTTASSVVDTKQGNKLLKLFVFVSIDVVLCVLCHPRKSLFFKLLWTLMW
eukprot:CAMPEP_0202726194 /NCGR_PEP_ID=MMETSP1385-20130828/184487_1 /ASSEMBLY_ACC=CAM_ASM_000861 /TAXON_ID=933848 /ORGANISM="Elphidium margaritaceum" /LENGTH=467 /DNA_ID=CAMNT_0049392409 /DNA_START=23 /DNA_END=1423 /DNA_ORIENTATION=-